MSKGSLLRIGWRLQTQSNKSLTLSERACTLILFIYCCKIHRRGDNSVYGTKTLDKTVVIITHKQPPMFYNGVVYVPCYPLRLINGLNFNCMASYMVLCKVKIMTEDIFDNLQKEVKNLISHCNF